MVEDDRNICQVVKIALEQEGYSVKCAHEGNTGLEFATEGNFDLLILDLMLPGKDGWEICNYLRREMSSTVPIIMLTALDDEKDRVKGLDSGADDYICKPFSPRELVARVKALLRRTGSFDFSGGMHMGGNMFIDTNSLNIKIGDRVLELPQMEYKLLEFLAKNKGKVFSREELLRRIWDFDYPGDNTRTVDEHIKRLRNRLAGADAEHTYIQTVYKAGYRFEVKKVG